jgi:hypothetical protein
MNHHNDIGVVGWIWVIVMVLFWITVTIAVIFT